jgi:hypothetical protein
LPHILNRYRERRNKAREFCTSAPSGGNGRASHSKIGRASCRERVFLSV